MRASHGNVRELTDVHEYELGPLRLWAREDLAAAYNRVVKAYLEAKIEFEYCNGFPWEASFDLRPDVNEHDLHIYAGFARAIEEAAEDYNGPPFNPDGLDAKFLLKIY